MARHKHTWEATLSKPRPADGWVPYEHVVVTTACTSCPANSSSTRAT
jgi:hypothetical protein